MVVLHYTAMASADAALARLRAPAAQVSAHYMVDRDGAVSLRGSENVRVHVNGKPVPLSGKALVQYMQSLSAQNVARIEVNTNPSARYDPEGTAGIINIVLNRTRSAGWSGGVSASGGTNENASASGNLGYQNGPGYRDPLPDLTEVDTTAPNYRQLGAYPLASETHGGEDVAAYATGPEAQRVRGVMEQNLLYDVMRRALELPAGRAGR